MGESCTDPLTRTSCGESACAMITRMRLTDFWQRMEEALGPGYARSWARDVHLAELSGLTAQEALDAGWDTKQVWRAVHAALKLPAADR